METIKMLEHSKNILIDDRYKDQLIRDSFFLESSSPSSFLKLQSDLAQLSIRDYESSLTLIRQLQSENKRLLRQNEALERDYQVKSDQLERVQRDNIELN